MLNREKMLSHLTSDEDKLIAAQTLDKAERVIKGEETVSTFFLDPRQQDILEGIIRQIPEIQYRCVGGFDHA